MKRVLALLLVLVGGLALVGCKKDDSTGTLYTVSMFGGTDPNAGVYNRTIIDYMNETGWKVSDDSAKSDQDWKDGVIQSFKNGNEPDVIQFFTTGDAEGIRDKVVSIEDIRKEYPEYAKNINPTILDEYAIPTTGFVEGIFTNTTHFKSAESKAYLAKKSWTWTEFKTLLGLLQTENSDVADYAPISLGQNIPHYWIDHIVAATYGENYSSVINGTGGDAKLRDALLKLSEIKQYTSYDAKESDSSAKFQDGKHTFLLDGSWAMGGIVDENTAIDATKVDVFPFPVVDESIGAPLLSGFTSGFYITKKAWNDPVKREQAVKFVSMMTSTANLTKFAEVGGFASDDKAVPANAHVLQEKLAALNGKVDALMLPLGDTSAAGSYTVLVEGQGAYFGDNSATTLQIVKEYLALQK